jgi:hypothetical protein
MDWQDVRVSEKEMAQYRPVFSTDPGPRYERALEAAHGILKKAADDWSEGNPEDPPTEEVLRKLLDVFIKAKFLRLPFGAGPT